MKRSTTIVLATATGLLMWPGLASAKDITSQLPQTQIDAYCSANHANGPATFDLPGGKTIVGSVDCAAASATIAAAGADDNGMEAESANDADSAHED